MICLKKELEGFDIMVLWAYLVIRGQSNQENILWIVEGGDA